MGSTKQHVLSANGRAECRLGITVLYNIVRDYAPLSNDLCVSRMQSIHGGVEMQQLETMYWHKEGKLARVTLNRPERLNAMNNQATLDLNTVADAIRADEEIRLVLSTGT